MSSRKGVRLILGEPPHGQNQGQKITSLNFFGLVSALVIDFETILRMSGSDRKFVRRVWEEEMF